ncbi:unnamed protein product [Closterium sp. Yama58-4]|nr:unnamed protein product [Closterium sp. Yama58-4]
MMPNSTCVVADGFKVNGEPKVKLSKEVEIVGEHKSAFPKTGVGIVNKVEPVKGEQFDKGDLVSMPMVEAVKGIIGSNDGGCGFE